MTPLALAPKVLLLALVLTAAAYDIRLRRIPNWLALTGVVLGISLNTFLYGRAGLRSAALGLCLAFFAYFVLYAIRAMGAGDVKLMSAVGAIVGPADWFGIFLLTAVLGGLIALTLVLFKGRLRKTLWNVGYILSEMSHLRAPYMTKEELDVQSPKAITLPHGAVIALGSLTFVLVSSIWVPG